MKNLNEVTPWIELYRDSKVQDDPVLDLAKRMAAKEVGANPDMVSFIGKDAKMYYFNINDKKSNFYGSTRGTKIADAAKAFKKSQPKRR